MSHLHCGPQCFSPSFCLLLPSTSTMAANLSSFNGLKMSSGYCEPDFFGYLVRNAFPVRAIVAARTAYSQTKYSGQSFQTRLFVLRGTILLYYVDHHHKEPKGVFLLDECKMLVGGRAADRRGVAMQLLGNLDKATPHTLTLQRPSGLIWELCARNQEELGQWVDAFHATGVVESVHAPHAQALVAPQGKVDAPSTPPRAGQAAHDTPGGQSTATVTPVAPEHRPLPYTDDHSHSGALSSGVGSAPAADVQQPSPQQDSTKAASN